MHAVDGVIAEVAKAGKKSLMTVSSVTVNDVGLINNEQLVANATLNGTLKGQPISLPFVIPLTLTPAPSSSGSSGTSSMGGVTTDAAPAVQVLNLSLGAVNLSLLGLNVHLGGTPNFGDTTPITVKITAIPTGSTYTSNGTTYTGGLLGDILSGVANLLNSGTPLSGLGSGTSSLDNLESGLTSILNQILGGLNSSSVASTASSTTKGGKTPKAVSHAMAVVHAHTDALPANQHEILLIPLGPINLDLLGALIQTSAIDLNITATKGPGDLLGNLLA
jgi:hypothetical protein